MTVEEIYSSIAKHQIKGLMLHEEMANYYDFLGLKGYKRCHEYHYLEESWGYRKLNRYYINHHNKLIPDVNIEPLEVIPQSWYRATRFEVDNTTKRNAIKSGLQAWHDWEKETKTMYEQMYMKLMDLGEVDSALFIKHYICDVSKELKDVERYMLERSATDYNLDLIVPDQRCMHEKYKEKTEKLGEQYESERYN